MGIGSKWSFTDGDLDLGLLILAWRSCTCGHAGQVQYSTDTSETSEPTRPAEKLVIATRSMANETHAPCDGICVTMPCHQDKRHFDTALTSDNHV